jgi:hypothetical protein
MRSVNSSIADHLPRSRQIERDNADVLCFQVGTQPLPIGAIEARQAIDLLNKQDITRMRIRNKARELGPAQRSAAFILGIEGRDFQALALAKAIRSAFARPAS